MEVYFGFSYFLAGEEEESLCQGRQSTRHSVRDEMAGEGGGGHTAVAISVEKVRGL